MCGRASGGPTEILSTVSKLSKSYISLINDIGSDTGVSEKLLKLWIQLHKGGAHGEISTFHPLQVISSRSFFSESSENC